MNRKGYPKDWKLIAQKVKAKADWKCQKCHRRPTGKPGDALTVHHRDGNPINCRDSNLIALCQRCHLLEQLKLNTYQVRKLKEKLGQVPIFSETIID